VFFEAKDFTINVPQLHLVHQHDAEAKSSRAAPLDFAPLEQAMSDAESTPRDARKSMREAGCSPRGRERADLVDPHH